MSLSTEIKLAPHTGGDWRGRVALLGLDQREWLRLPDACTYSGLKRAHFLELAVTEGQIRSFVLKQRPDALRGVRLFSRRSIDDFLNKKALEFELAAAKEAK